MTEAAPETVSGQGGRPQTIAVYLFVLALVSLVPAFIFSAILLARHGEAQEKIVEALMVGTSRSIVQAVERELTANITTLRVLGSTPSLIAGDMRLFHDRVSNAMRGTDASIFVLDSDFRSILTTRTEFGAPPVRSADPETARKALETNDIVVSDLVLGAVSQRWVVNVLMPVTLESGDRVVVGFNREADQLAPALLANKLPDGWNVALLDRKGVIIAASPGAGEASDMFPYATPDSLASSSGWVSLPGSELQAVVQRSPLTGWTLVAWAPRELIARPLANAFWSLLVGGVLLAAAVILIIYWVSLQIGRSVHGLEDDAKLLGRGQAVPARSYPITEIANVSAAIGEASSRRQAAEAEVRFLMRELAHRSKNQMTVIAAMAKQTARGAESVPDFVQSFEKRIFGLASSTDLLLAHGIAGVDLRELLTRQIEPFCPFDSGRIVLTGPAVRLNTQAAQILGMAGHELATNAVKYGAFAREDGTLTVRWARDGDALALTWREIASALPERPERRGFGTTVLESMVGRSLGAEVERVIHENGIEWRFRIPLAAIDPRTLDGTGVAGRPPSRHAQAASTAPSSAGEK